MPDSFAAPLRLDDVEHGIVHRDEAAFCSWPFLSGFWTTGAGDLLVAFRRMPANYADPGGISHDRLALSGPRLMTVRSTDRGASWDAEPRLLFDLGADPAPVLQPQPDRPPVDFTDPDVLVASGATPQYFQTDSRGWVRISTDGGHSWGAPVELQPGGFTSVSGNGSPLVRGDGVALQFVTVATHGARKRRPAVFRASENGAFWGFMAFITPEQDDGWNEGSQSLRYSPHRYFYPRPILLPSGRILCSVRCQRDPTSVLWTEIFASDDGGRSWRFQSRVNDWGAPGDLVRMADGRIACVYGWRVQPYGIRARLSEDEGLTWGRELILRDDGGSWDLGYPRVTEVEPGVLLAIYYFNRRDDPVQQNGGVRHIAWSRFGALG